MNKLRVFDAFSGIGGFRFGLKNSKLFHDSSSFVGYTDSDRLCRKVYSEIFNCPEEKCFDQIQDIHTAANPTNEYLPEFDLLLAGFPCQPFANIGHRRGFDDKRGTLIFRICELLEFYKPNYFILENVQKIRNIEKGETLKVVSEMLISKGYSLCLWDLCASNYGVPQQRRRMLFCGVKDSNPRILDISKPKKIDSSLNKYPTTWHLLEKKMPQKHIVPKKTSETVFKKNLKWEGDLKVNRLIARPLTATMAKWHRANQDNYFSKDFVFANTVTDASQCSTIPNNQSMRRISLLEGLRLQGFEDNVHEIFENFDIKPTAGFRLIGNSIPIPLVSNVVDKFFQSI